MVALLHGRESALRPLQTILDVGGSDAVVVMCCISTAHTSGVLAMVERAVERARECAPVPLASATVAVFSADDIYWCCVRADDAAIRSTSNYRTRRRTVALAAV